MLLLGATLDGNNINRRLLKLHNPKEKVYKAENLFTLDKNISLLIVFHSTRSKQFKLLAVKMSSPMGKNTLLMASWLCTFTHPNVTITVKQTYTYT